MNVLARPSLRTRITLGVLMLLFGAAFFLVIVISGVITPQALAQPANIVRIRQFLTGLVIVLFLLLGYGFWRVAGLIVYPLRELKDAVGFIAAGDLRNMEFLKATEKGALGELTASFRQMARELGTTLHSILIGAASVTQSATDAHEKAEAASRECEALLESGAALDADTRARLTRIHASLAALLEDSRALTQVAQDLKRNAESFKL